ncbi:MAG: ParA family protein [Burkholderiaceae bacterium]|nr:MAG: ParA family protein [Burkholderiaceae bacterium]
MPIVAVANPKGGVGKSTLATNIAGYWASQGHEVLLGDVDEQQSSRLWLGLRPKDARPIQAWEVQRDFIVRPSRGAEHVVLDTPAGLGGLRMREVARLADGIVIPLQPGVLDMHATQTFLKQLTEWVGRRPVQLGLVGMRVDERTLAAGQLQSFTDAADVPVIGVLRSTQNYVQLAARGLTVFDVASSRVRRDLEQWEVLSGWLDALS